VVVSYYDDPRLSDLYRGWLKIDCSRNKHLSQSGQDPRRTMAPEVLLINGCAAKEEMLHGD